jgi:integrase
MGTGCRSSTADAGKDETGKRKQIFKSGFVRKLDADIELAKVVNDRNEGSLVRPDPRTFAEFSEAWLAEYAETSCAPKTAERYREMMAHVARAIGMQPLSKVTTLQLQRVYNQLLKAGKKDGTALAIKTVRNIHGTVHVALETAIAWGLLKANPASRCKLPPARKREAVALDFSGARKLRESCSGHWLCDFLTVDTACGARRGELLVLTWSDVNIEAGTITISKSLEQTKHGLRVKETKGRNVRTVSLPDEAIGSGKGEGSTGSGPANVRNWLPNGSQVSVLPAGRRLHPTGHRHESRPQARKQGGFSGVSLHTLRHSHGSQLLKRRRSTSGSFKTARAQQYLRDCHRVRARRSER